MRRLLVAALTLAACAAPYRQIPVADRIAPAAKVGILEFRDCPNAKGPTCDGSGVAATAAFSKGFEEEAKLTLVRIARPVAANALITDKQAIAAAAGEGVDFVLVGDVHAYLDMQPSGAPVEMYGGGNRDQAGLLVRLIRLRDKRVVATLNQDQTGMARDVPDEMFQNMGADFARTVRQ